jgi:predicted PurR-regulated permease PerM
MNAMNEQADSSRQREQIDLLIRVALLGLAVVAAVRIVQPFVSLMLWGLVLAVTLYPLFLGFRARTGWAPGRAATAMTLVFILLIGIPSALLGVSFATHVADGVQALREGSLTVPEPPEVLEQIPLVGEKLNASWAEAHENTEEFLEAVRPQLAGFTKAALASAASTAGTVLLFIGALIVAGIMMAYGESGAASMRRIACRAVGTERGETIRQLSTMTVRSVAAGVVGVVVIQALLLGVGFLMAGIPAAGVLALVVLIVGILQLPALLVSLPAIAYLWGVGDGSTVVNALLTAYFLIAGAADNVLKPLLLGRGVDVPMPVVLIGALGGMVVSGIVGLFTGAVILSVVYQLFMEWVEQHEEPTPIDDGEGAAAIDAAD